MAQRTARGTFAPGSYQGLGRLGFGVGNKEYLDSTASEVSRYWRQIEEGSEAHVGRLIGGLWSSEAAGRGDRITGEPLSKFGEGGGEQFVPFSHDETSEEGIRQGAINALAYLEAHGQLAYEDATDKEMFFALRRRILQGATRGPTIGTIQKAIVGQHAYEKAAAAWDPRAREMAAIDTVFKHYRIYDVNTNRAKDVIGMQTGRKAATKAASQNITKRFRMLQGFATSAGALSLVKVASEYQSELVRVNRLLAEEFAQEVLAEQRILRPQVQTGALEQATLADENRFPH